jgi:hypothetical protein
VQRLSSFQDKVTPALGVSVKLHVSMKHVRSVRTLTADSDATHGEVSFSSKKDATGSEVSFQVPKVGISAIVVIE